MVKFNSLGGLVLSLSRVRDIFEILIKAVTYLFETSTVHDTGNHGQTVSAQPWS